MKTVGIASAVAIAISVSIGAQPAQTASPTQPAQTSSQTGHGFYTAQQATRGRVAFDRYSGLCHTVDSATIAEQLKTGRGIRVGATRALMGLGGNYLKRVFDGHPDYPRVYYLFNRIRETMPAFGADTVGIDTKLDIVAYILQANGLPPGDSELRHDVPAMKRMRLTALTAALPSATDLSAPQTRARQRFRVFVAVTDRTGAPVVDLSPGEFEVTEGGSTGRVVRASLVKEPMRIALLVDTSERSNRSLNHIRAGLHAFLDAIPTQDEILLMSTGSQARVRVATTLDRRKLTSTADGLFADGGASVLLDALRESWTRFLEGAKDRWPVFVIVGTDGPDYSNTSDAQFDTFVGELQDAAANAHAIVLTSSPSDRNTKGFAGSLDVTRRTGGYYEALAASSALPDRMRLLGERIAADQREMSRWYEVDFISQSRDPQVRTVVAVAREGMRVELAAGRPIK